MKIRNGIAILRESWTVLRQEPKLIWFPILSGITVALVVATIILAGVMVPAIGAWADNMMAPILNDDVRFTLGHAAGLLLLFLTYAFEYFVIIYFNAALVYCALQRFSGFSSTFSDGIRGANKRIPQILGWALLSAGVGTLLAIIEERLGFAGRMVISLIGLGWAVAAYFVVPILVVEGLGPFASVKRSVEVLKQTWGEGLTGTFSIGLITFLLNVGVLGVLAILAYVGMQLDSLVIIFGTVVIAVTAILTITVVNSALHQIFLAGLYQFTVTGAVPSGFSEATMRGALAGK